MKTLRKHLLVAAVATSLSLGGLAASAAGPWGNGDDCPMRGGRGYGRMGGDPQQWMEWKQQRHAERMELLQARLKLKPEQQAAWQGFIAAQDAHRSEQAKFWQARRDSKATTVPARFEERIQAMEQRLTGMKTMAKAAGDFYAVLDDGQKQVMDQFFSQRPGRGMRGGPGMGMGPGMGPGPAPEKADD